VSRDPRRARGDGTGVERDAEPRDDEDPWSALVEIRPCLLDVAVGEERGRERCLASHRIVHGPDRTALPLVPGTVGNDRGVQARQ
jgi:hypothetical protein